MESKNKRDLSNWPKVDSACILQLQLTETSFSPKKQKENSVDRMWVAPCSRKEPENRIKMQQFPASGITQTSYPTFLLG